MGWRQWHRSLFCIGERWERGGGSIARWRRGMRCCICSPRRVPADESAATLSVARSNVSTSLRELQGWGIVRVVHVLGDRRDHFETLKDVWELFRIVAEERKKREIDPTLRVLAECVKEVRAEPHGKAQTAERLEAMLQFLTAMSGLFEEVVRMPMPALKGVARMRGKV